MRWDASYLYVGAELFEPFVFANLTGHNEVAPYHDNDFEFFVDPAGSTEFYKEYEMSAKNATYDVLWGVPDGWGLHCDSGGGRVLPTCVNTSFPGYAGSWTMADGRGGAAGETTTRARPSTSDDRVALPHTGDGFEVAPHALHVDAQHLPLKQWTTACINEVVHAAIAHT